LYTTDEEIQRFFVELDQVRASGASSGATHGKSGYGG
jgi:hypothetical protein